MSKVRIDIVSDVVCPWCIIGYKRLEQALTELKAEHIEAEIHWHPFELNPAMKPEGQNLREHISEKYGSNEQASRSARETLTELGQQVGFDFNFNDDTRIYNTRKAHQLLMWSQQEQRQSQLEMALFEAYFTFGKDVSDESVLLEVAESVGIEKDIAAKVLHDESWAETVASTEQQWLEAGINAVPALIFNKKHLISGAQQTPHLVQALREVAALEQQENKD